MTNDPTKNVKKMTLFRRIMQLLVVWVIGLCFRVDHILNLGVVDEFIAQTVAAYEEMNK